MSSNPFRTDADMEAYLKRARAGWRRDPGELSPSSAGTLTPELPAFDEPESDLQRRQMKWAKDKGYPCQ